MTDIIDLLRQSGIQPTPQRIAVAEFILGSKTHPSADEVFAMVRQSCPTSHGHCLQHAQSAGGEGLIRQQVLREGTIIFDPNAAAHHHFVDEETGEITMCRGMRFRSVAPTSWSDSRCASSRSSCAGGCGRSRRLMSGYGGAPAKFLPSPGWVERRT